MAAKYSLESTNFANNLTASLTSLLNGSLLCDVTLVCDDGQLSAHKVVLAASSTFFSSVFQMNPQKEPLLYLRGVKADQLQGILQFLYAGTTTMLEEEVTSFLTVAADLRIVGLMGGVDGQQMEVEEVNSSQSMKKCEKEIELSDEMKKSEEGGDQTVAHVDQEDAGEKTLETPNKTSNPSISSILQKRPGITMVPESPPKSNLTQKATLSPVQEASSGTKLNFLKPAVKPSERKIVTIAPRSRRPVPVPSIFCPICQTTDRRSSTLKMHMESKREVQCRACKLYFGNCFSLGKHMKGRCRDKKAKEERKEKLEA